MTEPTPWLTRRRLRLLVGVLLFVASLYMITYSGRIESSDSRFLFDATESLVNSGDFYLNLTTWLRPPSRFDASLSYPLETVNAEPMQMFLAAPLYWVARQMPGIGMLHTVWTFNVIVGAAACGVFLLYALALGFTERTALLGALLLATATVVWPYSKTFFREPLQLLFLLLTGLCIERLRAGGYRSLPWAIAVLLSLIGALMTKASALMALPALIVLALPSVSAIRLHNRRLAWGIIGVLGGVVILFVALGAADVLPGVEARYNVFARLVGASSQHLGTAFSAYLLSPGGSIWGTSPALLLALPGAYLWLRDRRYRVASAGWLMALTFAIGYAVLNGEHWAGGLSWPPRFLVPVAPFLLLTALPVIERVLRKPISLLGAAVGLVAAYSLWMQLSGVTLWWGHYFNALPAESGGLADWLPAYYDPAYFRSVVMPSLWGKMPWDFAWADYQLWLVPIFYIGLAAGSAWLIGRELNSLGHVTGQRYARFSIAVLLSAALLVQWGTLRALHDGDYRYLATDDTLQAMLPIIEAETEPGDVLLLSSPRYEPFFLNYGKLHDAARVIVLPPQPGDQPSPAQPPEVESDYPSALLTKDTIPLIHNLAATRDRLWLLVDGGPDLWYSRRPVERFMSAHYYPVREIATGPITRLVEYSTISAPDTFAFRAPERETDLVYGESLHLAGLELPRGTILRAGEYLPVSLYWRTDVPIEGNYTVALFLRDSAGGPVAQRDSQPQGGFAPTSTWPVNVGVWDHHGLHLPADLTTGRYQLWVKVYNFDAGGSLRDLPVVGAETLEGVIGVLPAVIEVQNQTN